MKTRLTLLGATALITAFAVPSMASAEEKPPPASPCFDLLLSDPRNPDKVSLCHFTGGTTIVTNEVSLAAWATHTGHHGDCYKFSGQAQVCIP